MKEKPEMFEVFAKWSKAFKAREAQVEKDNKWLKDNGYVLPKEPESPQVSVHVLFELDKLRANQEEKRNIR